MVLLQLQLQRWGSQGRLRLLSMHSVRRVRYMEIGQVTGSHKGTRKATGHRTVGYRMSLPRRINQLQANLPRLRPQPPHLPTERPP